MVTLFSESEKEKRRKAKEKPVLRNNNTVLYSRFPNPDEDGEAPSKARVIKHSIIIITQHRLFLAFLSFFIRENAALPQLPFAKWLMISY